MAPPKQDRGNPLLPVIMALVILGVLGGIGYGVWYLIQNKDRFLPRKPAPVAREVFDPSTIVKPVVETNPPPVVKPVEKPKPPPPPPKPVEKPKKTLDEMKQDFSAAYATFARAVEARRAETKAKESFADIAFGKPVKGATLGHEELPEKGGVGLIVEGPARAKPFFGFATRAALSVTPRTRRVYRISFERAVTAPIDGGAAVETTNLVAAVAEELNCRPVTMDADAVDLAEREYLFPFGETTIGVGEYGGRSLRLWAEHAGIRRAVEAETEQIHEAALAETRGVKGLASDKYPNGGFPKTRRARISAGTPRAFCGFVFGSFAPPNAHRVKNAKGERGFYIDYRQAKVAPFLGFDHGRADLAETAGWLWSVRLYSEGPSEGLSDIEYVARVRQTIERLYKKAPKVENAEAICPTCTWTVGDLTVVLAPDPRGGYALTAQIPKIDL